MKIFYVVVILLSTVLLNGQSAFKTISYNIKWNDIMVDIDTWEDRKDAMLVFLQDEDADFLGLQEVLEDQLYFLSKELVHYKTMGVGRDDGKLQGEFSPILYNTKRWKSLESKTIWLSETPDEVSKGWDAACNRIATFGLFSNLTSGDTVAVFNTHLDHVGKKARRNSVDLILEFVKLRSAGRRSLILGDFNLQPTDPLYQRLTSELIDSRQEAFSVKEDHRGTFNGFKLKGSFTERIDYVFYSGALEPMTYECPAIRIQGRHVSDHFPVIVVFETLASD